jgi:hypothetical protein
LSEWRCAREDSQSEYEGSKLHENMQSMYEVPLRGNESTVVHEIADANASAKAQVRGAFGFVER